MLLMEAKEPNILVDMVTEPYVGELVQLTTQ